MKNYILFFILLTITFQKINAQQPLDVADSLPLQSGGLMMGYHILNEREKEVGDKGNFSRFNIEWYVTNTTPEAKIILYKQGFTLLSNAPSSNLAQFNCTNATGARLTAKEALIQARACNVIAAVDDKDCSSNKTVQNKRFVQIGYWIKAGETITTRGVVIVPLNEKPKMKVSVLYKSDPLIGSASLGTVNNNQLPDFSLGYFKLKNIYSNNYINNQNGPAACTSIDKDWWSAQWHIIAVPNTNYYLIKNKWKSIFLNNEPAAGFSTFDNKALNSFWIIETHTNGNEYTLKNAASNTYLSFYNGILNCAISYIDSGSTWTFEQ